MVDLIYKQTFYILNKNLVIIREVYPKLVYISNYYILSIYYLRLPSGNLTFSGAAFSIGNALRRIRLRRPVVSSGSTG